MSSTYFANDRASRGFLNAGRAASAASDDVAGLARRLDEIQKKRATARVDLAGDKEAQLALDKLDMRMLAVGRRVMDPKVSIDGAAKASLEITGLDAELDKLSAKSAKATVAVGSGAGGLSGVSGMGALIGAGVVLSPILTTIGFGVAGFGAAAAGAVAPVLKAAQAAGGLEKNMSKLDPEQQKVAQGLLGLGQQYRAFEQALQPVVLKDFSGALRIAGHLMGDLEPVSKATGIAIGGLLGAVDKELASGTWQQFFGFMATNAAPDVKLVSSNLVDLLHLLPLLTEELQGPASATLHFADNVIKAAIATHDWAEKTGHSIKNIPGLKQAIRGADYDIAHLTGTYKDAAGGGRDFGASMKHAAPPAFNLATAIGTVTGALDAQLSPLLTSQQDWVTWKQSQKSAKTAIDNVSGSLDGQSSSALAADGQIIASTRSALAFVDAQKHNKAGLDAANTVLENQINFLKTHAGKSRIAKKEIDLLREAEAKLHDLHQRLFVEAHGNWSVSPVGQHLRHHRPSAEGWRVPGFGGGDRWPALLEGGEAVVPKHLVPPLAPFLRANQVPGFAAGGFAGSPSGLGKWLLSEDAATLLALEKAVARATFAGMKAAQAGGGGFGVPGPGGGAPSANAALARRMFPSVDFASWNYVAMRESGWNQFARNKSSGAYGIPQALPPSKMGPAANPPQSNVMAQLSWMVGYMNSRYGGAGGAAAHERAFNWYDSGVQWLPPGPSLAYNGTGRYERVGGEDLAPLLRQVITELRKLPGVQAAQLGRVLSGRPAAPRPSVFAAR